MRSENRAPAVVALLVGIALLAGLPASFPWSLHVGVGIAEVVLLVPLLALNPARLSRETAWSRVLSRVVIVVLLVANLVALVSLLVQLVSADTDNSARLLLAAVQVWLTNVIAFSLLLWELDRGGPVLRRHVEPDALRPADLRFPEDDPRQPEASPNASPEASPDVFPSARDGGRVSSYFDYFYVALRNGMAIVRPDAIPVTTRAKALMALQAFSGFALLGVIVARAVSLLG